LENTYETIQRLSLNEYPDIVEDAQILYATSGTPLKLRVYIIDGSYMDIYLSESGKYSYHWEQRHINGQLYRHDNAPHPKWRRVETYPKHYHEGSEDHVVESNIPDDPAEAADTVLGFIRMSLKPEGS
jgi:hypothetical protein